MFWVFSHRGNSLGQKWRRGHWKRDICLKLSKLIFKICDRLATSKARPLKRSTSHCSRIGPAICNKFTQHPSRERPLLQISEKRFCNYIHQGRGCPNTFACTVPSCESTDFGWIPIWEPNSQGNPIKPLLRLQSLRPPTKLPNAQH